MTSPKELLEENQSAAPTATSKFGGKTALVPPKMTSNEDAEAERMDGPIDKLPLHEDIMQLARLGEIGSVQKLFEEKKFDVKYKDHEGITPLHVSD